MTNTRFPELSENTDVMKIAFVRTEGMPDRVYVTRTDGTETSWSFPTFGSYVPHDLVHLVVETAFGLGQGFWGRVDAGVDVARVNAEANRKGGINKYAKFGTDRSELYISEILAATRWADGTLTDEELMRSIGETCSNQSLSIPHNLSTASVHQVRDTLDILCGRWIELLQKGALNLHLDPANLESSFKSLGEIPGRAPHFSLAPYGASEK